MERFIPKNLWLTLKTPKMDSRVRGNDEQQRVAADSSCTTHTSVTQKMDSRVCGNDEPLTSREIGAYFEAMALKYLQGKGLRLLTQNFYSRFGEIDLIMLDKEALVFIEVRYRQSKGHGSALESITYSKQRKIMKSAEYFLYKHKEHQRRYCRFDALAIDQEEITWLPNAFTL